MVCRHFVNHALELVLDLRFRIGPSAATADINLSDSGCSRSWNSKLSWLSWSVWSVHTGSQSGASDASVKMMLGGVLMPVLHRTQDLMSGHLKQSPGVVPNIELCGQRKARTGPEAFVPKPTASIHCAPESATGSGLWCRQATREAGKAKEQGRV